ncbi:MAG TPA: lamin tail domain-containing protein, partial [Verrucomicrobiae bacterium]
MPALALFLLLALAQNGPAQTSGILQELFFDIGGGTVADLTNNAAFPSSPSAENILTDYLETAVNAYDNYGQRLQALITAPTSGNYRFWISSDDASQLYLSTDESPAQKRLIASVTGWTPSRTWDWEGSQQSSLISLTAGKRYYIEALMKEGGGGDNLAVRWRLPSGTMEEPIPASRCVPYGLGPPVFVQQPVNVAVTEGGTATFSVQLARTVGASYQWKRNGTNLPGATTSACALSPVRLSDSGSTFFCAVTNALGWSNSATATLTVLPDTTRPTLVSVRNLGDDQLLMVAFSEPVEAASAGLAGNYTLNNGASVLGVLLLQDPSVVALRTTPLNPALNYTLTVNNVRDCAQTPNPILPNSQFAFATSYTPLDVRYVIGTNEPAGPSSRRTALAVTEIMYHPTNRADGRNLEFIEIYNSAPWAEDLSGYRLSGSVDYTFPAGTTIPAQGYRVVAPRPADLQAVFGLANVLGPLTNSTPGNATNILDNGGGTIRLRDELNSVLLEVTYDDEPPWPVSPDGAGHSLVLAR